MQHGANKASAPAKNEPVKEIPKKKLFCIGKNLISSLLNIRYRQSETLNFLRLGIPRRRRGEGSHGVIKLSDELLIDRCFDFKY